MKRINLRNTGICSACAVTLAMEKPLEEEEIVLQDATIETSDVESKLFLLRNDKLFPIEKVNTDISYCWLKNRTITH
jgi:hypothetical protein